MLLQTIAVPIPQGITVKDAISWHGKLWIVTFWINAGNGWHRPSRLIRFDNLPHSEGEQTDFSLTQALPDEVNTSDSFRAREGSVEQIVYPPVLIPGALMDAQRKRRQFLARAA